MNLPIYCPFCNDTMTNCPTPERFTSKWVKSCDKRLNHKLYIEYNFNTNEVFCIKIFFGKFIANWSVINKELYLDTKSGKLTFPYFEPDLHDFNKLRQKIQKYLMLL